MALLRVGKEQGYDEENEKKKRLKDKLVLGLSFREGLTFLAAYMVFGAVAYSFVFERQWSFIDGLYFSCVCFSTIGYGDLCPSNNMSRLFTCVFGLVGIALLGTAVASVGSSIAQVEIEAIQNARSQSQTQLSRLIDRMPTALTKFKAASQPDEYLKSLEKEDDRRVVSARTGLGQLSSSVVKKSLGTLPDTTNRYLQQLGKTSGAGKKETPQGHLPKRTQNSFFGRLRRRLRRSTSHSEYLHSLEHGIIWYDLFKHFRVIRYFSVILIVLGGGAIMRWLNGSAWNWTETLYYCVSTASTIGFGEYCAKTQAARIFAVFFIPLSVAATGEILSQIAVSTVKRRQREVYEHQLKDSLTVEHLDAMDFARDGKVSREEYVSFMLIEMGFVTKEELDTLHNQFDRLDLSRSGYLDGEDLKLMAKLRENAEVE